MQVQPAGMEVAPTVEGRPNARMNKNVVTIRYDTSLEDRRSTVFPFS
jgi:hypothetical protein